ncbi:MAG: methyltransferase domain-containing protein [Propionibacteriaceae bacterium]|nr:methyltransferase domain-containing protein [Propionibacteriaceae bacterium]
MSQKWSGRAQAYAETFAGQCAHSIAPLLDALAPSAGARLLDVGTGTGVAATAALARGCLVTGADPEPDMLALAVEAAPTATFVQAALPRLPFPDAAFDLVSANFVVNHVPDPAAATRELHRVLAPGGRLGASIWPTTPTPIRTLWDDVVAAAGVPVPNTVTRLAATLDFPRTPAGLAGLLDGAGLVVERAWLQEFVHVVDPDLWWSGVTRGVANIGQVWLAQAEAGRASLRAAYDELSRPFLQPDGRLHLPGAAVLAVARRTAELQ